jgi:hypothetical protein
MARHMEPTPESNPEPALTQDATPVVSKRSWKKSALIGAALVIALAAISAVTYAQVIVPNKPENVLMSALENSAQAQQVSYKGLVEVESGSTAIKVGVVGAQDNAKSASDVTLNVTATGVTLPIEARLVDKNVYVKVGDLSTITTLMGAFGGSEASGLVKTLNQQVANKWISVDSTLLRTAGVSCFTDTKFAVTAADAKLLEEQYKAHPFALIQSSSSDIVNGKKVQKYEISIDDDKAAKYSDSLSSLSLVKALNSCDKNSTKATPMPTGDHDKTPLTVWVDKGNKRIVQIASVSTAADAKKGTKGSGKISFDYAPVSITAPTSSVPLLEVVGNLQKSLGGAASGLDLTSLLGGFGGGTSGTLLTN